MMALVGCSCCWSSIHVVLVGVESTFICILHHSKTPAAAALRGAIYFEIKTAIYFEIKTAIYFEIKTARALDGKH